MTSVFNLENTKPPKDQVAANYLLRSAQNEIDRRVHEHISQWSMFWESSEATPQEIAARMGPNAGLWFFLAALNKHAFQAAEAKLQRKLLPDKYLSTPMEVTVNPDGSVTLGQA